MKKLFLIILCTTILTSCSQNKNAETTHKNAEEKQVSELTEILANSDNLLNQEVCFKGWVSHTCKHSGRRCFIKSADGSVSIRVEAGGKINGFNKELTGENMEITGILKLNKLSQQYLEDWQAKVEAKNSSVDIENGGEQCSAELNNIQQMRAWMKKNKKDFYPIYYVNGTDYKVIYSASK